MQANSPPAAQPTSSADLQDIYNEDVDATPVSSSSSLLSEEGVLDDVHEELPRIRPNPGALRLPPLPTPGFTPQLHSASPGPLQKTNSAPLEDRNRMKKSVDGKVGSHKSKGGFAAIRRFAGTFVKRRRPSGKRGGDSEAGKLERTRKAEENNRADRGQAPVKFVSEEKASEMRRKHAEVIECLDNEIATLKRFLNNDSNVNLQVCKTVTRETLDVVLGSCRELLEEYGFLEERAEELSRQIASVERYTKAEMAQQEQELIKSKVELAESQGNLLRVKLELAALRRREKEEAVVQEVKSAAEAKLRHGKAILSEKKSSVHKLEEGIDLMEGNWH